MAGGCALQCLCLNPRALPQSHCDMSSSWTFKESHAFELVFRPHLLYFQLKVHFEGRFLGFVCPNQWPKAFFVCFVLEFVGKAGI